MAADAAAEEEAVRPSPPLIATLHRRLRDPSLVASFERRRPSSVTGGLVRPRWVLRRANEGEHGGDGGGDGVTGGGGGAAGNLGATGGGGEGDCQIKSSGAIDAADGARDAKLCPSRASANRPPDDTPTNATTYNGLPRRNYIDLRIQQNRRFADAQCSKCATLLSKLHPSDSRWKQRATALRSFLDEGLAACPTHEGLRRVEREFNDWISERGGSEAAKNGSNSDMAIQRADATSMANGDNPTAHPLQPQKGAEGRARAALRDALAERAFLLGAGDDRAAEGGAKGEMHYPLLAEADEVPDGGGGRRRKDGRGRNGGNSSSGSDDVNERSSSDSSRSRRRRRKRSKRKHRRHNKRGKRHRHSEDGEDERGRKGERRRPRDESRSPSRSTSVSSRSSSYRRRKHRRKERKRRKRDRRRSRDERPSEEDEGKSERSADMAGSER